MSTKEKRILVILLVIAVMSLFGFSDPSQAQTYFPTKRKERR
jgi:hypothetical protein